MVRLLQLIFVLLIAALGLAFHIRNDQPVELDFYYRAIELPLSWVLVAAFAVGVLLGFLAMLGTVMRLRREKRRISKQHDLAAEEVTNLRAIPLKDGP
ncbi:MAG: LapA family protein [Gammaproteobacteria bacterium]